MRMTPRSEQRISLWQNTGDFPFPALNVYPPPQTSQFTEMELRLLHNLSSITNTLHNNGTSDLTLWTGVFPRILSLISSADYLAHSLLAFSATQLAWSMQSADMRKLSIQYGTLAVQGLYEAINNFDQSTADSILAASFGLSGTATDW